MAGPCITSPYQIEPANSATKLRFSSSWLAEPSMRDRPCCCSRRWIAERDRLPAATLPAASSSSRIWRIERRGLSCLAATMACCTASGSLHRSEEHTSELQSLMRISYAVFCLKKKKITNKELNEEKNDLNTIMISITIKADIQD